MKKLFYSVANFIEANDLIIEGDRILISLSGGADSTLLTHFFSWYKNRKYLKLTAVHFNHHLRAENSDHDELFANNLCDSLGIECITVHFDNLLEEKPQAKSIEEYARELRYENLSKIAKEKHCTKIATAHTMDDNAETVLLNIFRGTSLRGLAGIPIQRKNIIRPLLCIEKEQIIDYLHENNLPYVFDESNDDNSYRRNYIRNEILPLIKKNINSSINQTIFRTTNLVAASNNLFNKQIAEIQLAEYTKETVTFDIEKLREFDKIIQGELIINAISRQFNINLSYTDIANCLNLLQNESGKRFSLTDNLKVIKERNNILFYFESTTQFSEAEITIGSTVQLSCGELSIIKSNSNEIEKKSKLKVSICGDKLGRVFKIRDWKNGDFFTPFGMSGTKNISDFLNSEKIELSAKKDVKVLENNGKIIWVIGHRIDNSVKITPQSKMIINLEYKPNNR